MIDYDVIIIGCGPAGMNACLYASRSNLKTLVIEKNCPGGKVIKANTIENWLGIDKISGVDLSLNMFKHSFSFGGVYEQGNVLDIIDHDEYKEVILKDKTYKCHAVIIAIGTSEKKIGIPGEEKFYGRGVSYCAVCDAALYKNKDMVVVGGSVHAIAETVYLSKYARKIYFVCATESFAEKEEFNQIRDKSNIDVIPGYSPIKILGKEVVNGIVLKKDNEEKVLETSVVFPLLGDNPDTKFIERLNIVNDKNYIVVNDKKETKIPGIYAVGDCTNTPLKQIVTASSDGALAAIEAYKYIKNKKFK